MEVLLPTILCAIHTMVEVWLPSMWKIHTPIPLSIHDPVHISASTSLPTRPSAGAKPQTQSGIRQVPMAAQTGKFRSIYMNQGDVIELFPQVFCTRPS